MSTILYVEIVGSALVINYPMRYTDYQQNSASAEIVIKPPLVVFQL